jgi:hypothetical protein
MQTGYRRWWIDWWVWIRIVCGTKTGRGKPKWSEEGPVASVTWLATNPTWTVLVSTLVFRALEIEPRLSNEGSRGTRLLHVVEKTKRGVVFQRTLCGAGNSVHIQSTPIHRGNLPPNGSFTLIGLTNRTHGTVCLIALAFHQIVYMKSFELTWQTKICVVFFFVTARASRVTSTCNAVILLMEEAASTYGE